MRRTVKVLTLLTVALVALLLVSGCAAISGAMNTGAVMGSWHGKTPQEASEKLGEPSQDITGPLLSSEQKYAFTSKTKTGTKNGSKNVTRTVTNSDPRVVRIIVFALAPGSTFSSPDGKKQFTVEAAIDKQTEVVYGVDASGKIFINKMIITGKNGISTYGG